MDLANLDLDKLASKGVRVELFHPGTGEKIINEDGSSLWIDVMGLDSKEAKSALKEYKAALAKEGKKISFNQDDSFMELQEFAVKAYIYALPRITLGWSEHMEWEGKPMKCTQENCTKLFSSAGHEWIVTQIREVIEDRKNLFLGRSAS